MTEETKEIVVKDQVDIDLVEKAYQNLSQIFSNHIESAMQEAGNYLIKEFYDDDIELARNKKSPRNESLHQLIERLQNRSSGTPSKSWIYQSIGLVIQSHDIEKMDKDFFQTFGKIPLSHKISLLPITKFEIKKDLINKIIDNNLSVRELEELKAKQQNASDRNISLLTLLKNPKKLVSEDALKYINLDSLKKEPLNKLKKYKEKSIEKLNEFQTRLEEFQSEIEKNKSYIEQYKKLISDIDKAEKTKKPVKRGRKKKS